jgi:HTH-type transcriptional regulator / antitoxin HigA
MIKPIKTEEEYDAALKKIHAYIRNPPIIGSDEADEAEVLAMLIESYESIHYPILPLSPIDAIKFRMEEMGWNESELNKILGYRSRKSEILSGKRKLSLAMIRKLHQVLNIPAETLIAEY